PSWKLIGSYKPAGSGARTITATYTLPAGATQAIRANFRYNGTASSCSTGGYDDHDDLIFAVQ
ncbi:MAG TPA: leucyl aminopeptidase, partial [Archangium sp.]